MFRQNRLFRRYKYRYRPTPTQKKSNSLFDTNKYVIYPSNRMHIQHKIQGIIALILIIATFSLIYIQLDREVMPTVMDMAELYATTEATKAINEAVSESLINIQATEGDFLSYDYNDQGELVSWNVNSILINTLCADIVEKVSEKLQNIGEVSLEIPLGNLTGSRIFANLGPDLSVEVLPVGSVRVDYDNEIRSTGINQVNHTVWLDIEATVQIVVPLFEDKVVVQRRVMLVDKMISGKVPPSYVNVPAQSILDVAPGDVEEQLNDFEPIP